MSLGRDRIAVDIPMASMKARLAPGVQAGDSAENFQPEFAVNALATSPPNSCGGNAW
ncbi:unnamed protein product [Mycolicibacterium canariasense]|uniref:Uncharacterized protein n=1 Tax=Mycolicibacterium canariasense TaxID=228230 RepID=A0A100WJR0_MYCCR|nr:unnamed protein product [Mycolicibacterium canariasense]